MDLKMAIIRCLSNIPTIDNESIECLEPKSRSFTATSLKLFSVVFVRNFLKDFLYTRVPAVLDARKCWQGKQVDGNTVGALTMTCHVQLHSRRSHPAPAPRLICKDPDADVYKSVSKVLQMISGVVECLSRWKECPVKDERRSPDSLHLETSTPLPIHQTLSILSWIVQEHPEVQDRQDQSKKSRGRSRAQLLTAGVIFVSSTCVRICRSISSKR